MIRRDRCVDVIAKFPVPRDCDEVLRLFFDVIRGRARVQSKWTPRIEKRECVVGVCDLVRHHEWGDGDRVRERYQRRNGDEKCDRGTHRISRFADSHSRCIGH